MAQYSVELINAVQQSLEKDGVLASLRSQLRAHVLSILKSQQDSVAHKPAITVAVNPANSKFVFD